MNFEDRQRLLDIVESLKNEINNVGKRCIDERNDRDEIDEKYRIMKKNKTGSKVFHFDSPSQVFHFHIPPEIFSFKGATQNLGDFGVGVSQNVSNIFGEPKKDCFVFGEAPTRNDSQDGFGQNNSQKVFEFGPSFGDPLVFGDPSVRNNDGFGQSNNSQKVEFDPGFGDPLVFGDPSVRNNDGFGFGQSNNSQDGFNIGDPPVRNNDGFSIGEPLVFGDPSVRNPFLFPSPLKKTSNSSSEAFKYEEESDYPIIKDIYKFVGRFGIYRGIIHHWVNRKRRTKSGRRAKSGYRENSVNKCP